VLGDGYGDFLVKGSDENTIVHVLRSAVVEQEERPVGQKAAICIRVEIRKDMRSPGRTLLEEGWSSKRRNRSRPRGAFLAPDRRGWKVCAQNSGAHPYSAESLPGNGVFRGVPRDRCCRRRNLGRRIPRTRAVAVKTTTLIRRRGGMMQTVAERAGIHTIESPARILVAGEPLSDSMEILKELESAGLILDSLIALSPPISATPLLGNSL
jgi:hypothetical protein